MVGILGASEGDGDGAGEAVGGILTVGFRVVVGNKVGIVLGKGEVEGNRVGVIPVGASEGA